MNRRLVVAVGLLALLVGTAGCTSLLGSGGPSEEDLSENATYDWDTNATATYNVSRSQYTTVITVENRSHLVVYRTDELGTDEPLEPRALQFRFPNGTVVRADHPGLDAQNEGQRTNLTLPQAGGQVAFSSSRPNAKRFAIPVFIEQPHSAEVIMPPRARVGIPLLSKVNPGQYSTDVENNRMTVHWERVERGPMVVRYYLARDILIFGSIAALLSVAGVVGALYYYRQIKQLEKQREEVGLDVETEDDDLDDGGPPPGMR
jgi:hypothetical protein